jgi:hypothetical protein
MPLLRSRTQRLVHPRADGHTRRTPCLKRIRPTVGVAEFAGRPAAPLYVTKKDTTP